jgi:hypothetical protein
MMQSGSAEEGVMAFVRALHHQGDPPVVVAPSFQQLQEAVATLEASTDQTPSLGLEGDRDCLGWVFFVRPFGHYFVAAFPRDPGYCVLADRSLGEEPVETYIDQDLRIVRRCVFLTREALLQALHTYYETGERAPQFDWFPEEEVW